MYEKKNEKKIKINTKNMSEKYIWCTFLWIVYAI